MNEKQINLLVSLNLDITELSATNLQTLKQIVDEETKSRALVRDLYLEKQMANNVRLMRVYEIKRKMWEKKNDYQTK